MEPYQVVGLVPTSRGIRQRDEIQWNLDHQESRVCAIDLPGPQNDELAGSPPSGMRSSWRRQGPPPRVPRTVLQRGLDRRRPTPPGR
jgi:hypothetical protein